MGLLIASFVAGLLTILAPCTISLLPIMLSSATRADKRAPLVVALSLGASVFLFTLLFKGTLLFIAIPFHWLQIISGLLISLLGVFMLWPSLWTRIELFFGLERSTVLLQQAKKRSGLSASLLLGFALGPVFTTCSPTYLFILGTILPISFGLGMVYLLAYIVGLMIMLIAVGYGSKALMARIKFAANPNGWFKKVISVLLIVLGLSIMTGLDKLFEQGILETGYSGPIQIEDAILRDYK
ncbi:cytochrome C biogenesis protein [Candidatus Gracilibacteria bacterium]|nr:cytochrome C biogenesis protein [Candidatus Gracilibacteria bacterium]